MFEQLQITEPGSRIVQICLNRPRRLNALGNQTIQELTTALEAFERSGHDVLLLTGAGRAFMEFEDRKKLPHLLRIFHQNRLSLQKHFAPSLKLLFASSKSWSSKTLLWI